LRTSLQKTNESIKQNTITYQKEIKSSYIKFSPSPLQDNEDENLAVFLERNYSQKKIMESVSPKNIRPTCTESCQTEECLDKKAQYQIDILKQQLNYEAKMKEEKENYYNIQINMLKYIHKQEGD
jgi:hypothetical protein